MTSEQLESQYHELTKKVHQYSDYWTPIEFFQFAYYRSKRKKLLIQYIHALLNEGYDVDEELLDQINLKKANHQSDSMAP